MSRADIVLGIFGESVKTMRVIPNKAYEALAMSLPLVTADTPAIRELLDERSAVLVPAADPQAIADALLECALKLDQNRPVDDISIVVLRVMPPAGDEIRRMSVRLPLSL